MLISGRRGQGNAGPVNVDVAAATAQAIPVLTTPARNADSVADFALGLLLALCRNINRPAVSEKRLETKLQSDYFTATPFSGG